MSLVNGQWRQIPVKLSATGGRRRPAKGIHRVAGKNLSISSGICNKIEAIAVKKKKAGDRRNVYHRPFFVFIFQVGRRFVYAFGSYVLAAHEIERLFESDFQNK